MWERRRGSRRGVREGACIGCGKGQGKQGRGKGKGKGKDKDKGKGKGSGAGVGSTYANPGRPKSFQCWCRPLIEQ